MLNKAIIYQFTKPLGGDFEQNLKKAVEQRPARDCGSQDQCRIGFTPPCGDGEVAVKVGDVFFLALRVNEKKIPPAAVRSEVDRIVAEKERATGVKMRREERNEIKDQVILDALPKTIACDSFIYGYINQRTGRVCVAGSNKEAETFCAELREGLGSFPVVPISGEHSFGFIADQMIHEELEVAGVSVGGSCTLKEEESKETATFKNADLHSDEVKSHLDAGLSTNKIELIFKDVLIATLSDDLKITSIKDFDSVKEEMELDQADDAYMKARIKLEIYELCVETVYDLLDPAVNFEPRPLG